MIQPEPIHRIRGPRHRAGVVLLFTLIVLTVLVTVVAILASRIAMHKHRQQYMIDYQNARYACDSGMKYALAALPDTSVRLVERSDEPDFSDVFYMTTGQYQQYLAAWAEVLAAQQIEQGGSFGAGTGMSGSGDPLAALAALLCPRASITAAPRFCTVGMNVSRIHPSSPITSGAGRPLTSA